MKKKYIFILIFLIVPPLQSMDLSEFTTQPTEELFPGTFEFPNLEQLPQLSESILQDVALNNNALAAEKKMILAQVPYKNKTVIKLSWRKIKTLKCELCNKVFSSEGTLNHHLKTKTHKSNLVPELNIEWINEKPSAVSPELEQNSSSSGENYPTNYTAQVALAKQLFLAEGQPRDKNVVKFNLEKEHKFACTLCEITFETSKKLNYHNRRNHLLKCHLCDFKYASNKQLNKHVREKHA